jgi:hypothetical protein
VGVWASQFQEIFLSASLVFQRPDKHIAVNRHTEYALYGGNTQGGQTETLFQSCNFPRVAKALTDL